MVNTILNVITEPNNAILEHDSIYISVAPSVN